VRACRDTKCLSANKHTDQSIKYYEMFRGKNHGNKTDFFNRTDSLSFIKITQSVIYQDYTVCHLLRLVAMYA
jgi:hypothetical protein